jgi:hypothetical protein
MTESGGRLALDLAPLITGAGSYTSDTNNAYRNVDLRARTTSLSTFDSVHGLGCLGFPLCKTFLLPLRCFFSDSQPLRGGIEGE